MNDWNESRCGEFRQMLSEYIDNTLPANRAWAVEKHLTTCDACSAEVEQLRATVDLLHAAPRCDTSDHFMAALHARLDTVEAGAAARPPFWLAVRRWLANSDGGPNRVPALSLGLAVTAAVVMMFAVNRPAGRGVMPAPSAAITDSARVSDSVHVSVASSANSPFSDPAADNLELRAQ